MFPVPPLGDAQGGSGVNPECLRDPDGSYTAGILPADLSNVAIGEPGLAVVLASEIRPASFGDAVPLVLGRSDPSEIRESVVARIAVNVVGLHSWQRKAAERLENNSVNQFSGANGAAREHDHLVSVASAIWSEDSSGSQLRTESVATDYPIQRANSSEVRDFVEAFVPDNRKPSFWGILFGSHLASAVGELVRAAGRATVSRSSFYFRGILPCVVP